MGKGTEWSTEERQSGGNIIYLKARVAVRLEQIARAPCVVGASGLGFILKTRKSPGVFAAWE